MVIWFGVIAVWIKDIGEIVDLGLDIFDKTGNKIQLMSRNATLFCCPDTSSPDEEEVYKALQVCLEMRDSYVFRETIAPCKVALDRLRVEVLQIFNNKEHGKASAAAV
ncbi:hypothetical protein Tco_0965055, partial [Tanacetum coccineum]